MFPQEIPSIERKNIKNANPNPGVFADNVNAKDLVLWKVEMTLDDESMR